MNIQSLPNREFASLLVEADNGAIRYSEDGECCWFTVALGSVRLLMTCDTWSFGEWEPTALIAPTGGFWCIDNRFYFLRLSGIDDYYALPALTDLWESFNGDVNTCLKAMISRESVREWAAEYDGRIASPSRGEGASSLFVRGMCSSDILEWPLLEYGKEPTASLTKGTLLETLVQAVEDWTASVKLVAHEYFLANLDQVKQCAAQNVSLADELARLESSCTPELYAARELYSILNPLANQGCRCVKVEIEQKGKKVQGSVEVERVIRAAVNSDTLGAWDLQSVTDRLAADAAFGARWQATIGGDAVNAPRLESVSYRGRKIWESSQNRTLAA